MKSSKVAIGWYEITTEMGHWSVINLESGGWRLLLNGQFIEWYRTKKEAMQDIT